MHHSSSSLQENLLKKPITHLLSTFNNTVFLFLDFLDSVFCLAYNVLDLVIEGKYRSSCYCFKKKKKNGNNGVGGDAESEVSDTLYQRRNLFRDMGLMRVFWGRWKEEEEDDEDFGGLGLDDEQKRHRWSDCSCSSCFGWMNKSSEDQKLHFVVTEPSEATPKEEIKEKPIENVIFLHGFICSSSFWTQTIFPKVSETVKKKYRMFAVDLLGFGKSPKPRNCLYTIKDHRESIETCVILPYQLDKDSFHIVAHSMGCIVALALAAKYSKSVKSIVLVAPPYFPSGAGASMEALNKLAKRRLWPPLLFGASFMSWYEHLGRTVCFLFCRNHKIWESILRFTTMNRNLSFEIVDLTKHTHHSAWHSMHNVICGGANLTDSYLKTLAKSGTNIHVFQGDRDQVVPPECRNSMKMKFPDIVDVEVVPKTDHRSIILGREMEFLRDLERIWMFSSDDNGGRKRRSFKNDHP